jgi:hypothetical protein
VVAADHEPAAVEEVVAAAVHPEEAEAAVVEAAAERAYKK